MCLARSIGVNVRSPVRPLPQPHASAAPASEVDATWRFVGLLVRQRLLDAYRGTRLGALWALLPQLVQIAVLALILGTVMQQKLGTARAGQVPYVVFMLPGVLLWQVFHDTCVQTADYLQAQKLIVKKNRVHLLWLAAYVPIVQLVLHAVFTAGLWVLLRALYPAVPATALAISLLAALILVAYAFVIGLAAAWLSVALPDIRQILPSLLQVGFWLTPIVYPPQLIPVGWATVAAWWHPWYGLFAPVQQAWSGVPTLSAAAPPWAGIVAPALIAAVLALLLARIHRYGRRYILDTL